jgi:peptidoglycan/LPS O-acetylase OafA/YrhL
LLIDLPPGGLEWDHEVRRVTILHLDATGWGVLAAITNRWWPQAWASHLKGKALLGLALTVLGLLSLQALYDSLPATMSHVLLAWPRFPVAFALTCMGLGTFLALPAITRLPDAVGPVRSLVEAMSNYSYSIYLSHVPVLVLVSHVALTQGVPLSAATLWGLAGVWLLLTFAVSAAVYHSFEKPVSDLRERFTRKVDARPFGPAPPP